MARSSRIKDIDNYEGDNLPGQYQRVSLNDVISNFIIAYIGKGKVLTSVPRYEVAFWAQRTMQEFSYDILHSEKSVEIEMNDANIMLLPSDFVNYISVSKTDSNGIQYPLLPSTTTKPTRAALQDDEYNYIYDENGDIVYPSDSEALKRFKDNDGTSSNNENIQGGYYGNDNGELERKRFGLNPQTSNNNGHFVLDRSAGKIHFDNTVDQDDLITLHYISDGIADNDDLNSVYLPKLAEDAMYASILYNLSKLRPEASGAAALYKKEAMAKMRNAKLRLSNYKHSELAQLLRGRAKWIKH